MTAAIDIKKNIATLIAALDPPLVPTSHLTSQANPGDGTLQIDPALDSQSRSRFLAGGRISIYDGKAESNLPIRSVSTDGTGVTLDVPGMLTPGLVTEHDAGTMVYTNLTAYATRSAEAMMGRGDPVIWVTTEGREQRRDGMHFGFPTLRVCVRYMRLVDRPAKSPVDEDVWAEQQENGMLTDMERIELMLLSNQELITDFSPSVALQFAPVGQNNRLIESRWTWAATKNTTWILLGEAELLIAGIGVSLSG